MNQERIETLKNYWPNITLNLEGYDYILTPNDYYFEYNEDNKIGACIGFEGEGASKIILGGTFMHGHDIIFDKDNQMIGISEADGNRGFNTTRNKSYNDNMIDDNYIKKLKEKIKITFLN